MSAPKLRFKEFDGDWNVYTLDQISNIKTGPFGSTLHQEDYVESGTPIITVEHLGDFGLTMQNLPLVSDEDKIRLKSYVLQEGDIAFSRVGSVDRCAIITKNEEGWLFSGRILRVKPNKKIVDSKNLMYALKTEETKYRIRSVAVGQTMPSLNTEILKNFTVTLSPSKEEQAKIASFLSAVDQKISQLTKKYELLSQYKQGIMQKLFSQQIRFKMDDGSEFGEWEKTNLGKLCSRNYQGINTVADKVEYEKIGYPILQAKHITSEELDFDDVRYLSETDFEKYKDKYIPQLNDILFSNIGTIGKVVLVKEIKDFFIAWNIFLITPKLEIASPMYLVCYLRWLTSLKYFDNLQTGNATKFINKTDLLESKINLPCLEEQTKIANFLSAIDQKIEVVAQQIEQAKTWKKGLLQQMFV